MKKYWGLALCLFSALCTNTLMAQEPTKQQTISNLEELSAVVDQIRLRTNTPGIAVGIVQAGQPNWEYYSGMASLASRAPLDPNSQFRFGSISKMLVALSLLTLEEQGKLSLDDKIQVIAPEIAFSNPWEATHPLRIVHLLNHSSGWDSPHFSELKPLSSTPVAVLDVLNVYPDSRVSRWQPGSRIAYNNTGFLVAAYLVEKTTGQSFESFVTNTFFKPLYMDKTGYYFSDTYRDSAVSLYVNGQEQQYRHLNHRSVGGLNSTLGNMLEFSKFLANENTTELLTQDTRDSFRTPSGTRAAQLGSEFSWGLGNQLFHSNGVALYGHEGNVRGANAMLIYSPKYQFAYVIAANSNSPAVSQIHHVVSQYLTKDISMPKVEAERVLSKADKALSGWYKNIAPISKRFSLASTIVPWKLELVDKGLSIKPLIGGQPRKLIPNEDKGFKQNTTDLNVLIPVLDDDFGEGIYYGPQTFEKTNVISAILPLLVLVFWLIMALVSIIFMLIWLPRSLFKKSVSAESIRFRLWSLISVAIALALIFCVRHLSNSTNMHELAASASSLSVFVFIGSIGFVVSALWSIWMWYKNRNLLLNAFTKWQTALLCLANTMLSLLLLTNGLIGLRLWA